MDISHNWSNDLAAGADGDLLATAGTIEGQQRILRRLMTVRQDYIWHRDYGAGVPLFIGSLATPAEVSARVRGQMQLEDACSQAPEPVIVVTPITAGLACDIKYVDSVTQQTGTVSFDIRN